MIEMEDETRKRKGSEVVKDEDDTWTNEKGPSRVMGFVGWNWIQLLMVHGGGGGETKIN